MPGMWEQIERLNTGNVIAPLNKLFQITRLRSRVARDVNNPLGAKLHELLAKAGVAPLTRRVDHHRSLIGRKLQSVKNSFGLADHKTGVAHATDCSIRLRPAHCRLAHLNTGDHLKRLCCGKRKQPDAAIRINQIARAFKRGFTSHILDQFGQDIRIILKKLARLKLEGHLTDAL